MSKILEYQFTYHFEIKSPKDAGCDTWEEVLIYKRADLRQNPSDTLCRLDYGGKRTTAVPTIKFVETKKEIRKGWAKAFKAGMDHNVDDIDDWENQ